MGNNHNDRVVREEHWLIDEDPELQARNLSYDPSIDGSHMIGDDTPIVGLGAAYHIQKALESLFPSSVWDDSVAETARRVAKAWAEYVPTPDIDFNFTTFTAAKSQMVFIGDMEFSSLCAHHLMPFTGKAHVAYLPGKVQAGLSKIPRLVRYWAARPQVQENLTAMLLKDLKNRLATSNVMVVLEARHSCVSARGARLHNGVMRTALPSGMFLSSDACRQEFYALLARNGV